MSKKKRIFSAKHLESACDKTYGTLHALLRSLLCFFRKQINFYTHLMLKKLYFFEKFIHFENLEIVFLIILYFIPGGQSNSKKSQTILFRAQTIFVEHAPKSRIYIIYRIYKRSKQMELKK